MIRNVTTKTHRFQNVLIKLSVRLLLSNNQIVFSCLTSLNQTLYTPNFFTTSSIIHLYFIQIFLLLPKNSQLFTQRLHAFREIIFKHNIFATISFSTLTLRARRASRRFFNLNSFTSNKIFNILIKSFTTTSSEIFRRSTSFVLINKRPQTNSTFWIQLLIL